MHHEGTICPGGMAAIIGMDEGPLQEICQEATERQTAHLPANAHPGQGRVTVANFNAPGQIVISGEQAALEAAMELVRARGAKRVIPLAVSGAFHSPVMRPAAVGLAEAIAATQVNDVTIPVIGNIEARPLSRADEIREELAQQIATPVQWVRIIEYLKGAGVTVFLEIGPGQALSGMVKRIVKGATTLNVSSGDDIKKTGQALREMHILDGV
jgi:[acyl-carrier-protein] S-malonyltransferase